MIHSMARTLYPMLLLALVALPGAVNAVQTCRSQSEIPASTPTARFTDQGETVTDSGTGLMWAKCSEGQSGSDCATGSATAHTWQEALDLASASTLAGYSDWRLPNIKELVSIAEEQCVNPAINLSVFPNTPASSYWSASPYAAYSDSAWYVYFNYGYSYYGSRYRSRLVRLVRGGQLGLSFGDLSVGIGSNQELFRPGNYGGFSVNLSNPGPLTVTGARLEITTNNGFIINQNTVACPSSYYSGFECFEEIGSRTPHRVVFQFTLPSGSNTVIRLGGKYAKDHISATFYAQVSGGTPTDSNPSNNSVSKILSSFPADLPGTQEAILCNGPGSCDDSSSLSIDLGKPTVILTHGLQKEDCNRNALWTDFGASPAGASHLLSEFFISNDVNLLQYHWKGACHGGSVPTADAYIKGRQNVYHAGEVLAEKLETLLAPDGSYGQNIHFIGHSLGTAVNAYASRIFLEEVSGIPEAQVTILDYPNRVSKILDMSKKDQRRYGFDRDFFAEVLPFETMGDKLKVDNYYSKKQGWYDTKFSGAGVGTEIRAPQAVLNRELDKTHKVGDALLPEEGVLGLFDNDHSGVHQWYRWSMRPNEAKNFEGVAVCSGSEWNDRPVIPIMLGSGTVPAPMGDYYPSLDPCQHGWHISILHSGHFITTSTKEQHDSRTVALEFTGGEDANCTLSTIDGSIVCVETLALAPVASLSDSIAAEASPPTVSYLDATMTVPVNARYITFDYRFTNVGDGDYVYLLVDDKPVWKMSGDAVTQGEWNASGPVTIAMEPGENTIVVALYGVGDQNAQFEMKNFQFIEVLPTFEDVPPAHTAYESVEALADDSVVEGCNADDSQFCPDQALTRDTLALWLMKAKMGEIYDPGPAEGLFDDVPKTSPFADWIEAFSNEGLTEGCGTSLYCPNAPVDKAQFAKLLLVTLNGIGYTPDTATGDLFDDVGIFDFNANWIEDAARKGLLEGCGYKQFCPDAILNRSAMARIVESAF